MKKILLIFVCLIVVGSGVLFAVNIKPEGQSVGTVIGNAIDGAVDDVVSSYHSTGKAITDGASKVTYAIGDWLTDLGASLKGTSDEPIE